MRYFLRERDDTRGDRMVFRVKAVTVLLMFACFWPGSKYHVAATFAIGYSEMERFPAAAMRGDIHVATRAEYRNFDVRGSVALV